MDNPPLKICRSENVFFWEDECEELGQYKSNFRQPTFLQKLFHKNRDFASLPVYERAAYPTEFDFKRALAIGMGNTPARERQLRIRIWWAANDNLRKNPENRTESFWNQEFESNLIALTRFCEGDEPVDLIMRAEIFRELGEFDRAAAILDTQLPKPLDLPKAYTQMASGILKLAEKRMRFVECVS